MTGVIYARYSSDSQREENIEGQLRECMAYAERSGITIIGNYIDRAMSARTADRPDFQRMINDSEKRLFDAIIVWKLDRFSRDRYDSATYKHILKKNGVKVISATENISDSPEGILLESLLEGLSEYYSAELSVKIQGFFRSISLWATFRSPQRINGNFLSSSHRYAANDSSHCIR